MCRVLAAAVAELLELETAGGRLLVLRRRVVPLLAIRALQCDDFAHLSILPHRSQPASPSKQASAGRFPSIFYRLLQDLRNGSGADGSAAFADGEPETLLHR